VDCVGQLVRERDSLINGWTERKDDAKWAEKRGRVRIMIMDQGLFLFEMSSGLSR
jgi:hypothetical protein